MTARSGKLASMLERDTLQEASTRQQTDHMIELCTGNQKISEADMNLFKGTMLFTAQDLRRLLEGKNTDCQNKQDLVDQVKRHELDIQQLRDQLKEALA